MNLKRDEILSEFTLGEDGIYSYPFTSKDQAEEVRLRESVANKLYDDYLFELSRHHSIPVMDREVKLFLEGVPKGGIVVDVGGCWGWHWRNLKKIRPDVKVYIIDFIRSNLLHAKKILGTDVGGNVFLICGDATNILFDDDVFDGYWSVQTLQHIPDFEGAINEAFRILKNGGVFASYSLNLQKIFKYLYKLFGKKYHVAGNVPGHFYLARACSKQRNIISKIFSSSVGIRYTEILFKPEFKVFFSGREKSLVGVLDSRLSNGFGLFSSLARQQSYHIKKNKR